MAAGRIDMPDGLKLRTNSSRRYVIGAYRAAQGTEEARWVVWARSDSRDTILARWRSYCRTHSSVPLHVVDTVERTVIR